MCLFRDVKASHILFAINEMFLGTYTAREVFNMAWPLDISYINQKPPVYQGTYIRSSELPTYIIFNS